jgi:hypothetical protein
MDHPQYSSLMDVLAAVPDPCKARGKRYSWVLLLWLALAELLAMGTWFSASAVIPALSREWSLDEGPHAWITIRCRRALWHGVSPPRLYDR